MLKFTSIAITFLLAGSTAVVGYGKLQNEVENIKAGVHTLEQEQGAINVNSSKIETIDETIDDVKVTVKEIQVTQIEQGQHMERISTLLEVIRQDIRDNGGQ